MTGWQLFTMLVNSVTCGAGLMLLVVLDQMSQQGGGR